MSWGFPMRGLFVIAALLFLGLVSPSCIEANKYKEKAEATGLNPGVNYMQPVKWRMTYHYRVREIHPDREYVGTTPPSYDPLIPTVGPGTYEVWFVGPREGEEIRGVKQIYASPEPTEVAKSTGDINMYYYDFAPDGHLPREIQASIQWEFITFERYAYWKGMPELEYDKNSELFKTYTAEESPITFHKGLVREAKSLIPKEYPNDYVTTAMNCYNYILANFEYDLHQEEFAEFTGRPMLYDSSRCWDNKTGQCDEFANVICSMLRSAGIPCRPVAGLVHQVIEEGDSREVYLMAGGHAWAEFYIPEVGWIPLDPTWGMSIPDGVINPYYSYMGYQRNIPGVDYFFGKHDPFRITMFKGWNTQLNPAPKTPNAESSETWFVGHTDRMSGIKDLTYGWEGSYGRYYTNIHGWARAADQVGYNFRPELEILGPVDPRDIPEVIKEIEAEGNHFVDVPAINGNWPFNTIELEWRHDENGE
ncbi:transglutaminase domain-containing protein [bacterium]|nr:transglutaminase domain-containing protein [bacterium]